MSLTAHARSSWRSRAGGLLAGTLMLSGLAATSAAPAAGAELEPRFAYTVTNGEATILGYAEDSPRVDRLSIPATLDDGGSAVPVTAVEEAAFMDAGLTEVELPASVRRVGVVAFGQNPLTSVTIHGSGVDVGWAAFNRRVDQTGEPGFDTVVFTAGAPSVVFPGDDYGASFATDDWGDIVSTPTIVYPAAQDVSVVGPGGFTRPIWMGYASEPDETLGGTVPNAPVLPTTSVADRDLTVSWTAPFDGDSPIIGYTVTAQREGAPALTRTVDADVLSVTFEDLAPGKYAVTVVATNAVGPSAASEAAIRNVFADDTPVFTYTVAGGEATVTGLAPDTPDPTSLAIPASVTDVSGTYPVTAIGRRAFNGDQGYAFTEVLLPEGIRTIGGEAFANQGLTGIALPDAVATIGEHAFLGNDLGALVVPESVTRLDVGAFLNAGLTSVRILAPIENWGIRTFESNAALTSVTLPDGITSIPPNTFADGRLAEVSIPDSVTSIGRSAFTGNRLTEIDLPDRLEILDGFANNRLTALSIPDSVVSVDGLTRNELTSVRFPADLTTIAISAFAHNRIETLDWGTSAPEQVGDEAFRGNLLRAVDLPASVRRIGELAFGDNPLESATINGDGLRIGVRAFRGLPRAAGEPGFDTVTFRGTPPASIEPSTSPGASFQTGTDSGVAGTPTVRYPASQDAAIVGPGGFTAPTWLGYAAASYDDATVPRAPGAPTLSVVGGTGLRVTWSAPIDGGSPITRYTVTLTPTGAAPLVRSVDAPALTTTFEDLTPGRYTATVVATNAVGSSPASPSSLPVQLRTAPAAPAAPQASVAGSTITVTWSAPADGNSPITGYTVTLNRSGSHAPVSRQVDGSALSVVFENLDAGSYTVAVVATNAIGSSSLSPASAVVTVAPAPVHAVGTSLTAVGTTTSYGRAARVGVTVTPASGTEQPTGTVTTRVGTRTVTATLVGGRATLVFPARSLAPGRRSLSVTYAGQADRFGPSSTTLRIQVAKASSRVRVTASRATKRGVVRGGRAVYTVQVTAPGLRPTGRVTVRLAGRSETVRLRRGRATVRIAVGRATRPGTKPVSVSYRGDDLVAAARTTTQTTVRR
jgi:uncharacterized protein (DUF2141 family)